MNDREEILIQLSAYLDGELSEADAKRVEKKLSEDAELATELAQLKATRQLLRSLPQEKAGDDFASRVLEQAERQHLIQAGHSEKTSMEFKWVKYLATAAVFLVAAGIGTLIVIAPWTPREFPTHLAEGTKMPETVAVLEKESSEEMLRKAAPAVADEVALREDEVLAEDGSDFIAGKELAEAAPRPLGKAAPAEAGESFDNGRRMIVRAPIITNVAVFDELALAKAETVEINTKDLVLTQQHVEKILKANSIEPLVVEQKGLSRGYDYRGRSNVYQTQQLRPSQFQYVAYVTEAQIPEIKSQLEQIPLKREKIPSLGMAGITVKDESAPSPSFALEKSVDDKYTRRSVLAKSKADEPKKIETEKIEASQVASVKENGIVASQVKQKGSRSEGAKMQTLLITLNLETPKEAAKETAVSKSASMPTSKPVEAKEK